MRFLLDTHTFLWFIGGDERLSATARQLIADIEHELFLSTVSLWEIALKTGLGKLTLRKSFDELFPSELKANEITVLAIDIDALSHLINLPFHHRAPFDRLLIAQAIARQLPIIGKDSAFKAYAVDLIW